MALTQQRCNIADLHTDRLLAMLKAGEEIVLYQAGQPLARIIPYPTGTQRTLGEAKGMVKIHPDFDTLPDDFMAHFS
jgi:antitoxin (DNA-binding transcriptional repressor) of toxin-antitoxin stability system